MNKIDIRKALQGKLAPQRHRVYRHKAGAFLLTADFRDPTIDDQRIDMVAALVKVYTQKSIARIHAARLQ